MAQSRTVGLLSIDTAQVFNGYNLFFPHGQSDVFLVDNCGQIINRWEDNPDRVPGNSVYLKEDGHIIKASRYFDRTIDSIWAGGGGAFVEEFSWEGDLLWSFELNNDTNRLHHDFEIMPNGHILMIAWEKKSKQEAIENGRAPSSLKQNSLWPDFIFEYNPNVDSIVWEWHAWDHLIQDLDSTKLNYGNVQSHPEKIDVNYQTNDGNPDWLHSNSIAYHEDLDQIILSVPHFDEAWIIDHSTNTEEAKGSTGGNSNRGGDLIFRWGNPRTYTKDTLVQQQLFFQHDIHWIRDFIDPEDPYYNKILLFNNRAGVDFSTVNVLGPEYESISSSYQIENGTFQPDTFSLALSHPLLKDFYSSGLSSAQYLPNGNWLILAGRYGYAFELNTEGEILWEYRVPFISGLPATQGSVPGVNENLTFRLKRYPTTFSGFNEKDLSQKGTIEMDLNNIGSPCDFASGIEELNSNTYQLYPNPTDSEFYIDYEGVIDIYDMQGSLLSSKGHNSVDDPIDISELQNGIYLIKTGNGSLQKVVKF